MSYIKEYIPYYKRNLRIAVPVMLAQLGQGVTTIVDTIMVGHLGTVELAAVSFGGAIFIIGFLFAMGLSFGATPLVGRTFSSGQIRRTAALFQNSLLFALIVTLVVGAVMWFVSLFLGNMGQPDEVWPLARVYYLIMLSTLPSVMLFQACRQFLEGLGNTKYAMLIVLVGNVLNIFLNWVLIFGRCGFDSYGVAGAGYATLIARVLMAISFVIFLFYKRPYSRYFRFFQWRLFSMRDVLSLTKIGVPIGFQMMTETLGMSLSAIMVGWLGAVALASHEVAMNISSLTFLVGLGVSSATTIRVSHQVGMKDFSAMRKAGIASIHLGVGFGLICTLLVYLFRVQIAAMFTTDPAVVDLGSLLVAVVAFYQVADCTQVAAVGGLRGLADVKFPMYVAFLCYIVLNLAVGYVCGFILKMGAVGVWMGYVVELYLAMILLVARFLLLSRNYSESPA